jgi:DNA-binding response OmpR family regulator
MEPLVVYPEPPSPDLARTLDLGGYQWKAVSSPEAAATHEPPSGWGGAVVACDSDPEGAWAMCRALRRRDDPTRLMLLLTGAQLGDLELRDDLYDDFCLTPFHPVEVEARLRHLLFHGVGQNKAETVEYSGLALNVETYQASIEGRPLDLTYMEYELLKFLVTHPRRVFSREALLNRVWGYDYYGGARTVDVHVRRVRAKLGSEHAARIKTVRSVGYRWEGT